MLFENISLKRRSIFAGIFILTAYLMLTAQATTSKPAVFITDVLSGLSVIGIALLLFPVFKSHNKLLSSSYLYLKIAEGIIMIIGGFIFFDPSLQTLRHSFYDGIHLYVFILSGFILYHLLFKSKAVPPFIAIWGTTGILALAITTGLKHIGINYNFLDYFFLIIITNEIFLAIWLMIKGLDILKES